MAIEQGMLFRHDFGPRSNHLQEGPRPVLIVQNDALNRLEGYDNVVIIPVTSKEKKSATYVRLEPSPLNGLTRTSWAIANQIFTISKADLREPLGAITPNEIFEVKEAMKVVLAIR